MNRHQRRHQAAIDRRARRRPPPRALLSALDEEAVIYISDETTEATIEAARAQLRAVGHRGPIKLERKASP